MFRVGQPVECVDASGNWHLTQGAIYTIIGILPGDFGQCDGLHLAEAGHTFGTAFYSTRFRPIVERKTDISVFERLLNPVPVS